MKSLRSLAANPAQYDNLGEDWLKEGCNDSAWRRFFKNTLGLCLGALDGQAVLDIGCGSGWMSEFVYKKGARSYTGVEPSRLNFKTAKALHKNANFINSSFEEFNSNQSFDLITCLMSTEHIDDLEKAFVKWYELLGPSGRLLIIAGDFEAFATVKFDYSIEVEKTSDKEFVVYTRRPRSVDIADIIRSPELFLSAAKKGGFNNHLVIPLTASEELIKECPNYEMFRHNPIYQLMIFQK